MDKLQFAVPVRIAAAHGRPVEEVYGVEQALDFLHNWPTGRQGPLFQLAFDACFGASVDVVPVDEACKAFAAFCRVSGVMARDIAPDQLDTPSMPPLN